MSKCQEKVDTLVGPDFQYVQNKNGQEDPYIDCGKLFTVYRKFALLHSKIGNETKALEYYKQIFDYCVKSFQDDRHNMNGKELSDLATNDMLTALNRIIEPYLEFSKHSNLIDQEEVLRDIKRVAQSFEKTGRSKPKHYGDLVCAKGTVLADLGRLEEASKANIKAIRHFRKHLLSHSILSNNENKDLQLLTISYRREISDTIRSYQRAAKKLFIYNVNKEAVNDAIEVYEEYLTLVKPIHQIYYVL